jgi:hypothetical protein
MKRAYPSATRASAAPERALEIGKNPFSSSSAAASVFVLIVSDYMAECPIVEAKRSI